MSEEKEELKQNADSQNENVEQNAETATEAPAAEAPVATEAPAAEVQKANTDLEEKKEVVENEAADQLA